MTENIEQKGGEARKSVWGRVRRVLKWAGVILVVILGLMIWAGNNIDVIDKKIRTWQAERYDKAIQKYTDEMKARYAADKDGGKTPEETIELFIAALKAGDIEKASRYYVLEKQEEELRHLKDDILGKYGNLQKSIDFYTEIKEKGVKKCNKEKDGCVFEYVYTETATTTYNVVGMNQKIVVPPGEKTTEAVDVALNKFSGVWKIELP